MRLPRRLVVPACLPAQAGQSTTAGIASTEGTKAMLDLDPAHLAAAITLCEPLNFRHLPFDIPTFDLLKQLQRKLESRIRRDTSNAEVVKYLIHTHPEARAAFDGA